MMATCPVVVGVVDVDVDVDVDDDVDVDEDVVDDAGVTVPLDPHRPTANAPANRTPSCTLRRIVITS